MDASDHKMPWEIPELLEQVLLNLTQGQILQAQRVCHSWLDTICASPLLQQKLYFQPLPPSKASERPPEFNPIAKALFPFLFEPHAFLSGWLVKQEADRIIRHWNEDPARREAVLRPEASWRRMLPIQPAAPIDGFVLNDWNVAEGEPVLEWAEVDPSRHASNMASRWDLGDSATMGLLYDIVVRHLGSERNAATCVQWNMVKITRRLCHQTPRRNWCAWALLNTPLDPAAFGPGAAEEYEKVEPRNAITVHAIAGAADGYIQPRRFYLPQIATYRLSSMLKRNMLEEIPTAMKYAPRPEVSTNPTDPVVPIDLPDGVVRTGNKANRYANGNLDDGYLYWGRLAPGLESELDRELRKKAEFDAEWESLQSGLRTDWSEESSNGD